MTRRGGRRRESGQGSLELVAMVAAAALLVGATTTAVVSSSPAMSGRITFEICKIVSLATGGSCADPSTDPHGSGSHDYVPPQPCAVTSSEDSEASSVSVTFVKVSANEAWKIEDLGDGTARVSHLTGAGVGATAGVGGGVTVTVSGKTYGLAATADIDGMLNADTGEQWTVPTKDVANLLLGDKKSDATKDEWFGNSGPLRDFADWVGGGKGKYEDAEPDSTWVRAGADISGSAGATGLWDSAAAEAGVSAYQGTMHHKDGTSTDYFTADASASIGTEDPGVSAEASASAGMSIEVDRDKNGKPIAMRVTTKASANASGDVDFDETDTSKEPEETDRVIQLPLTSDADRKLASKFLSSTGTFVGGVTSTDALADPTQAVSLYGDLQTAAKDHGHLWNQTYSTSDNTNGFAASGELGVELGADASWTTTTTKLTKYEYWNGSGWATRPGCVAP